MGIARGAWLVKGSWLDACLAAGAWVDEEAHVVGVRAVTCRLFVHQQCL